jgi:hypothetical protein
MSTTTSTSLTLVSTTAQARPGDKFRVYLEGTQRGQGEQEWIYVKNTSATATAVGTVMAKAAGVVSYEAVTIAATSSNPHKVVGVAQHAIAAGSYGWILRKGPGFVLADATGYSVDTGLILDASTAGCAADAADPDDRIFGVSYIVQVGAGATGKAMLNCIG